MRRSEPLNTSNRLLGGHRRRRTQFGRTRSQGLCRWAVPGLAIFVPPGVSWSPRGLFLNQIGNRVVRSGIWRLWPVPLFLFLQACAVRRRTGRGDGARAKCGAVGATSLRRSAKVHQQCSAEAPQNRARKAQNRFAGAERQSGLPPATTILHGPLLRREFTPSRSRCCWRTSMFGCSPLRCERRCRKRLPGSPLRFPV